MHHQPDQNSWGKTRVKSGGTSRRRDNTNTCRQQCWTRAARAHSCLCVDNCVSNNHNHKNDQKHQHERARKQSRQNEKKVFHKIKKREHTDLLEQTCTKVMVWMGWQRSKCFRHSSGSRTQWRTHLTSDDQALILDSPIPIRKSRSPRHTRERVHKYDRGKNGVWGCAK